ncbi:MAG: STAS domain-containing protein [Phycisphaerae bacterium]|nr:STAS domain-containing protein [Phycisphaerae bacterium]
MTESFIDSEGALRFRFPSEVDTAVCDEIREGIFAQVQEHEGEVIFDLLGVQLVTSAFFRICITTMQSVGKERMKVKNLEPRVKKTFMIAQLHKVLDLE